MLTELKKELQLASEITELLKKQISILLDLNSLKEINTPLLADYRDKCDAIKLTFKRWERRKTMDEMKDLLPLRNLQVRSGTAIPSCNFCLHILNQTPRPCPTSASCWRKTT